MKKSSNSKSTIPGRTPSGRFAKGYVANPNGMKPGYRRPASVLAENLMTGNVEKVVKAVVKAALGGDIAACKLILERIYPVPRTINSEWDERLSRIERAMGIAAEQIGRIPQVLESDDERFDEQGSTGTH